MAHLQILDSWTNHSDQPTGSTYQKDLTQKNNLFMNLQWTKQTVYDNVLDSQEKIKNKANK